MVGNLCGKEVIILIDSGSTHNFISESLASRWRYWNELQSSMQVRVANGQILTCSHEITVCPIWISGYAFKLPLKILPLHCYDVILGIDWLEQHSPMEVN
jgi:predicted aspartyl protease